MVLSKEEHFMKEYSEQSTVNSRETWVSNRWRPAMAWLYFVTCIFDFIIAPIASAIIYAQFGQPIIPWSPITLQGAGLYHLAMGAIVGITSWSRGQERICALSASTRFNREAGPSRHDMMDADHIPRRHDPESRNIS
jgi:hypothetical protein